MTLSRDTSLHEGKFVLRCLNLEDAASLAEACNDSTIHHYILTPYPYTIEDAADYITLSLYKWDQGTTYNFAIVIDDKVSGMIGLMDVDLDHQIAEVGYWLGKDYRGQGITTAAVKAITEIGFHILGLHRLWARVDHDNLASQHVLQNAGFVREGVLKEHAIRHGERKNVIYFGMIAPET